MVVITRISEKCDALHDYGDNPTKSRDRLQIAHVKKADKKQKLSEMPLPANDLVTVQNVFCPVSQRSLWIKRATGIVVSHVSALQRITYAIEIKKTKNSVGAL